MKYHSVKDPIRIYTEVLGGKWRLLILYQLFSSTQRFKDLLKSTEGITPRMLTKELRSLEKFNLVEKEVYKEVPPRVEYSLTDEGVKLYPLIENIQSVGNQLAHLISEDVSVENTISMEYDENITILNNTLSQEHIELDEPEIEITEEVPIETEIKTEEEKPKTIEPKIIDTETKETSSKETTVIQLELF